MNDFIRKDVSEFMKKYGNLTVGDAIKLNEKERSGMRKRINWEKVLVYGVSLGFMSSTIYLLLVIASAITA